MRCAHARLFIVQAAMETLELPTRKLVYSWKAKGVVAGANANTKGLGGIGGISDTPSDTPSALALPASVSGVYR